MPFFKDKVCYLVHIFGRKGLELNHRKINKVVGWPVPKSKTDVRAFLGLCSYYRRFIRDFSTVTKPLTELTKN